MEYLDFEVEVRAHDGERFAIAVRSAAGEARSVVAFPFPEAALKMHLASLAGAVRLSLHQNQHLPAEDEAAVRSFGRHLFEFLFSGEVGGRYRDCQQLARSQGKGLRVKLILAARALAGVPWELLYDPARRDYLCLDPNTPLVRYAELPLPVGVLAVKPPLRILGVCIDAVDLPRLDVAGEKERMTAAVRDLQAQGLVELTWLEGQTADDLQRALRRGVWHVLHFVGHGGFTSACDEGMVMLADSAGKAAPMYATQLTRLLAGQRDSLRLVLLNACKGASSGQELFSSTAATLMSHGIPAVVAMQHEISDEAAVQFARAFYEALADDLPVETAVTEARNAISLRNRHSLEWSTPVLSLRARDGQLFELGSEPVRLSLNPDPDEAYVVTIFSEQAEYPALVKAAALRYFEGSGIQPARGEPIVTVVEAFAKSNWERQLELILRQIPDWAGVHGKLHVVCATPWLWAFALGTRIGNTLDLTMYHFDRGQIFPVWAGKPSVQEWLQTPDFGLRYGTLEERVKGEQAERVALTVAIGRDDSAEIVAYLAREQPGTAVWCYRNTRTRGDAQAEIWLQSAAELAYAIEQIGEKGKRTVYLLGSAPAALALMAGSAVKRFRPVHLFQFSAQTQQYRKLLALPLDGS